MHNHPEREQQRPPYLKVGVYSLIVNLTLVATKLSLSFITGSLALRADAIHSGVDVFGSIALIVGLIIANRKTMNFPYGLYKVENVVAVVISLLLFVTAYEIASEAVTTGRATTPYRGWILGVVGILILVPFFFSRYEISVGTKSNSPSLVADGKQFRADVLSASIVFFALVGQYFGFPLDRIAASIIALFIVRAGWGLLSSSMRVLLDASVDRDTLDEISSLIKADPAVSTVKNLAGRNSGRYIFVEATVALRISDLKKAHLVSQRVENKIKDSQYPVDRVLIHYEPESKTQLRYAIAVGSLQGEIAHHFGESPYFALVDIDLKEKRVQRQEMVANPHRDLEKGKGIKVAEFLLGYKPDIMVTQETLSGKGPGYTFAEAGVETMRTEAHSLDELLGQLVARLGQQ